VLDLARELAGLGHEVSFYSYVPKSRVVRFGLQPSCHRGLLGRVWPLLLLRQAVRSNHFKKALDKRLTLAMDHAVSSMINPCDVLIGMSGLYLKAGQEAQRRYGALFVLERGSRHILSQKEILDAMPGLADGKSAVADYQVERELAGYAAADVISVPSRQAESSFLERGFPREKMFRNSYGVDLTMFPPTEAPGPSVPPTILYVGAWTWQKGVDVLVQAWRKLDGVRLLHVGAQGDQPMPRDPLFGHIDPVPQWELVNIYRRAHVFVLASRQEGLSLVQAQALACGLPVVCTDRTGGEDFKEYLGHDDDVTVVPHDNADALAAALHGALIKVTGLQGLRDGLGASRDSLSWAAYGKRYGDFLISRIKGK
jgi:starch synthase